MLKSAVLFILLLVGLSVSAKETDNITDRYKQLEDSTEVLNKEMNRRLAELEQEANDKPIACGKFRDLRILFHELNDARFLIGAMESWAEDEATVAKQEAQPQTSVFNKVLSNGLLFNRLQLASTIKVNGELIGTDKLGHFIDQGFQFYTYYRQSGYDITVPLSSSLGSERSWAGLNSTGLVSYADSMANYQGILFYHDLGEGSSPYFKCVDGKWSQIRSFNWADYVDAGWDEGLNCNVFKTDEQRYVYERNVEALEKKAKDQGRERRFTCPVEPQKCAELQRRHSRVARWVLSPTCRSIKAEASGASSNSSGGRAQEGTR